ncbi:inositol pentakisphosphate 2-kinase [Podospora australis]|uniref:Inositol-pentakisphosphate 2-kinase n=1 Tax=Podospora australis TaxID=1536484 RepID=A0AAN7AIN1_9PEZI|nr:inositol pentakisphosphate 2-kinase [Podospora australis]
MPPTTRSQTNPELSLTSLEDCQIKFIGEGAANLVFAITPPPNSPLTSIFNGYLLRVPKAETKTHDYPSLQSYWETTICPLFPSSNLVQQRLIRLSSPSSITAKLNTALGTVESTRRPDFQGTCVLSSAEYGMLVEDMRSVSGGDLSLEFKPKWLSPSPSAPPSSLRCRNCAREALRNSLHPSHHKSHHAKIPCPLDLLHCSHSSASLSNMMSYISPPPPLNTVSKLDALTAWLQSNTLLPQLRQAQIAHDKTGPLGEGINGEELQLAMTLRDCSCFLRIPSDYPRQPVEAKLADLDKKNWEKKLSYWQGLERELIEGGYYEAKEEPRQVTDCWLERQAKSLKD